MPAGNETTTNIDLFTPLGLGDLTLPNRVVMAPLTRNRAAMPGNVPQAMNATYYAQRASAGLMAPSTLWANTDTTLKLPLWATCSSNRPADSPSMSQ